MGPQIITDFSVKLIGKGMYLITAPPLSNHIFLVLGKEKAMLIDTGLGLGSLRSVVEDITELPIILINTHGHPDHCGGNAEFTNTYMNLSDRDVFEAKCSYEARYKELSGRNITGLDKLQGTPALPNPVEDGQIFDLGGREMMIIYTPGHTKGSICIYDGKSKSLFAGDNIMAGNTDILEPFAANISDYRKALLKLSSLDIEKIYAGHSPYEVMPSVIVNKITCTDRILNGEKGEYYKSFRGEGYSVVEDSTGINYAADKRL